MKKLLIMLCALLTAVMPLCARAELVQVDVLDGDLQNELLRIALEQARKLDGIIREPYAQELFVRYSVEDAYEFFTAPDYGAPTHATFVLPSEDFDEEAFCANFNMPLSSACSTYICELNTIYRERYAVIESRLKLYDVAKIDGLARMAYVDLVYGKEDPHIIVAFSETDSGEILVQTCLFYNPDLVVGTELDERLAFVYTMAFAWDGFFDIAVYKMDQED